LALEEAAGSDPRFWDGMRVLTDHRRLNWQTLSMADLHARVDAWASKKALERGTVAASVFSEPVDYGLARIFRAYAEERLDRLDLNYCVFYSMEEARSWLRARTRPSGKESTGRPQASERERG
jgi:hypothetical protein